MAHLTEDTVNDRVAEYLRSYSVEIYTQFIGVGEGATKPDFFIKEPRTIYGEGEWETTKHEGFRQMTDYAKLPGAEGSFLLIYPKSLKNRTMEMDIEKFFGDVKLTGLFSIKTLPSNPFHGTIKELPEWIELSQKGKRRHDKNAQIVIITKLVDGLTTRIPKSAGKTQLFQHVAQFLLNPGEALKTTNRAVAYLLVNQVVFYRILSSGQIVEPIDSSKIKSPPDLHNLYFEDAKHNIDYEAVFGIDVASLVPKRGLQYIKDLIDVVDGMRPESFSSRFLSSMFHRVIPLSIRKPIAAYYTNRGAASLLAGLTLDNPNDKVADFACGSGTLIMAAYDQKTQLLRHKVTQKDHKRFIEQHITGMDVMIFAGHLAAVQLSLKHPTYMSNEVRIGIEDSLRLYPKYIVKSLQKSLPVGQSKLTHYEDPSKLMKRGAIGQSGAGHPFVLNKVDVILMNPPFTRKQRIKSDYRLQLRDWLSDYEEWISDSFSLWAYFLFLADKFIKNGKKVGFVLPVAILKQSTYSILREFICKKYEVRFVIVGGYKCAFSENTAFRECLLIMEKRGKPRKKAEARFVFLKEAPTSSNSEILIKNIKENGDPELTDICQVTQEELSGTDDWWAFIPEPKLSSGFKLQDNKVSPLVNVLGDEDGLKQGLRFQSSSAYLSTTNSIISHPREGISVQFKITDEGKDHVFFTDGVGNDYKILKSALCPAIRTLSYNKTIGLKSPPDWLVINRFDDDETFWDTDDVINILTKRNKHKDSRLGNLVLAGYGNFNFGAPGSCVIATSTDFLIAPTWSCWRLVCKTIEDAKILALFFNSSFTLAKLLDLSVEVEGSTRKWRKPQLINLLVLDPLKISDEERKYLLKIYNEVSDIEFPSLLEQLRDGNEWRDKIDHAIAKVIVESGAEDSSKIRQLQLAIAEQIDMWVKMMKSR